MRILLTLNKTLYRGEQNKFDNGYYNLYVPLLELGHQVYFYDTINPIEKDFSKVVEEFKPDLIFCCITGNAGITRYEPLAEIQNITQRGNIVTFNWFCDDTWRYEGFSKYVCKHFAVCSTPEINFLDRYKKDGYDNIILGQWHCNEDLYLGNTFKHETGFCGGLTNSRKDFISRLGRQVMYFYGSSYEDVIQWYSSCKMTLNLTVNDNDPQKKTQMKLRIFEGACANSLVITENTENLEHYYDLKNEIVAFENIDECRDLIDFYSKNENARSIIAANGHRRFLKEHTSKIRLKNLINSIFELC